MNRTLADYVEKAVLWVEGKRCRGGVVKDKSTIAGESRRFGPLQRTHDALL